MKNDSRWAFTAVPKGTPPSGGWPVLIDLAIIDYTPVATNGDDEPKKCGLDGLFPPGENPGFRRRQLQSEAARPPSAACTAALVAQCGAQKKSGHSACSSCIKSKYRILEKAGCGFFDLEGYCGGKKPAPHPNPGGGGMTEEYAAFATPEELMGACSCFEKNGMCARRLSPPQDCLACLPAPINCEQNGHVLRADPRPDLMVRTSRDVRVPDHRGQRTPREPRHRLLV